MILQKRPLNDDGLFIYVNICYNLGKSRRQPMKIILESKEAEIVEKKSRFIANIAAATSEEEATKFIENIKKNREGKTNIIVAHRISAVRHADKIVVLDNGKILNSGTHDELLEKCPWYKQLDEYQNKEVEDDEE